VASKNTISLYNQFFHNFFQQEYHFTNFRWFRLQLFGLVWVFWGFLGFHQLFASRRACGAAPKNCRFPSRKCRINREIQAIISTLLPSVTGPLTICVVNDGSLGTLWRETLPSFATLAFCASALKAAILAGVFVMPPFRSPVFQCCGKIWQNRGYMTF